MKIFYKKYFKLLTKKSILYKNIILFFGKKKMEIPFVKSYNYIKKGELLTTIGSSNLFEIALNQGNAGKKLGMKPDDEIKIQFN